MDADRETRLLAAVRSVREGGTLHRAARTFNVPRSTLSGRLAGRVAHRNAHDYARKLSPKQEESLTNLLLGEVAAGNRVNKATVRDFAAAIARDGGDDKGLGANWIDRYFERRPEIKRLLSRKPRETPRSGQNQNQNLNLNPAAPSVSSASQPARQTPRDAEAGGGGSAAAAGQPAYTSRRSHHIRWQLLEAVERVDSSTRALRAVMDKAGSMIDEQNALIASLQAQQRFLEAKIRSQDEQLRRGAAGPTPNGEQEQEQERERDQEQEADDDGSGNEDASADEDASA
jgi:hypothetical protein